MKFVKYFLSLFRWKWGENYERKEKDKDILLILVIVHVWILLLLGLYAEEHLRKVEERKNGGVTKGEGVFFRGSGRSKIKNKCSVVKGFDCTVICKDLDLNKQNDEDDMYASLENAKEAQECKLTLDSVTFNQYKLQENWLHLDPDKHANITKLEIGGGRLTEITYNSFACLPYLSTLTIYNTGIQDLLKNSFTNMPKLQTLELRNNTNLAQAEFGFLQNFKLQTLQIQQLFLNQDLTVEFLGNLTGDKNYPSLSSLDLSFNNIGYFPRKILQFYSSRLVQLVISNSNVTEFENGTFSNVLKNGKIVVDRNKLTRFPRDEYEEVVENIGALFVKDNKLICDCEMEWLQSFIKEEKNGDYGDFNFTKCDGPEENHGVPFLEAEMCQETTWSTMSPTSTTTPATDLPTEPPTEPPTDTTNESPEEPTSDPCVDSTIVPTIEPTSPPELPDIPINCKTYSNSRFRRSLSLSRLRITKRDEITIHLSPPTEDLLVEEADDGNIIIKFKNNETSKSLLYWEESSFQPINETDIKCYTDIKKTNINLPDRIESDENYVFCLFKATDNQINILNCRGFKSSPDYNHRTWISNKMIPTAVTAAISTIFVCIIVGASIFYLIVRKKPSLIRGSERVIVVKRHNKAHIVVMPRGHSESTITGSSKYALTDSATDPSFSGDSISTVSYVSVIQPTPLDIFRYRVERLRGLTWGNQSEDDDDGNRTPPPLPPYPIQMYQPQCQARLPPNVDLLFEYEWYTTTTTTTTTTS